LGLSDLDMRVDPCRPGKVHGCGGRARVDGRAGAGVAVREHVDSPAVLSLRDILDQADPMLSDTAGNFDVFFTDRLRFFTQQALETAGACAPPDAGHDPVDGPP